MKHQLQVKSTDHAAWSCGHQKWLKRSCIRKKDYVATVSWKPSEIGSSRYY